MTWALIHRKADAFWGGGGRGSRLDDAGVVPNVCKGEPPHVPLSVYPATQGHLLPHTPLGDVPTQLAPAGPRQAAITSACLNFSRQGGALVYAGSLCCRRLGCTGYVRPSPLPQATCCCSSVDEGVVISACSNS
jgi:hypothetical protein